MQRQYNIGRNRLSLVHTGEGGVWIVMTNSKGCMTKEPFGVLSFSDAADLMETLGEILFEHTPHPVLTVLEGGLCHAQSDQIHL